MDIPIQGLPTEVYASAPQSPPERGAAPVIVERYEPGIGRLRLTFEARKHPRRGAPGFWALGRAELLEPAPEGEQRAIPTLGPASTSWRPG